MRARAVLVLLLFAGCADNDATVTGELLNADGSPLANQAIRLLPLQAGAAFDYLDKDDRLANTETQTDSEGRFTVKVDVDWLAAACLCASPPEPCGCSRFTLGIQDASEPGGWVDLVRLEARPASYQIPMAGATKDLGRIEVPWAELVLSSGLTLPDGVNRVQIMKEGPSSYWFLGCGDCHGGKSIHTERQRYTGEGPDLSDGVWVRIDGSYESILSVIYQHGSDFDWSRPIDAEERGRILDYEWIAAYLWYINRKVADG